MARDYDSQLLESVTVRRRRMGDALLFGAQRARRTADGRLGKLFAGLAITAVLCAGCVGWSFIQHTLAKQKAEQQRQQQNRVEQFGGPAKSPLPTGASAAPPRPSTANRPSTAPHPSPSRTPQKSPPPARTSTSPKPTPA